MRFIPFVAFGVLLASSLSAEARGRRYILRGIPATSLRAQFKATGGEAREELTLDRSLVADLDDKALQSLRKRYKNVEVEEDAQVSILGHRLSKTVHDLIQERMNANKLQTPKPGQKPASGQTIPWGLTSTRSLEAFEVSRGAGVKVCIIDTGIQADHPDLAANVIGGRNFVSVNGKVNASAWNDDNGHGTHVAGTIAALDNNIGVVGVAPDAKIIVAKALDKTGFGYHSAIAEGIRYCVSSGAKVINMSLGGSSGSTTLKNAVSQALKAGVVIVAAAGNDGTARVNYPAAYSGVLAISAIDSALRLASFSNTGSIIAFAGPGVNVLSTVPTGGYATYSGTSMATPHVAGIVALGISAKSLGPVGRDIKLPSTYQGRGLIDALNTVNN